MVWLVGVFATALAAATPAPSADHVRDVVKQVVKGPAYQTSLPDNGTGGPEQEDPLRPGAGKAPADEDESIEAPVHAGPLGFLLQWLMYIVIGAVLVVLIFWLITELGGYEKDAAAETEPSAAPDDASPVVDKPLGDAEALARQGRFAEAIHTLLLRTLEELVKKLATPLPKSMTSREILVRVKLPDEAQSALSGLVTATELCWFGDAVPGADDYQACVARWKTFASAYTRGLAA